MAEPSEPQVIDTGVAADPQQPDCRGGVRNPAAPASSPSRPAAVPAA